MEMGSGKLIRYFLFEKNKKEIKKTNKNFIIFIFIIIFLALYYLFLKKINKKQENISFDNINYNLDNYFKKLFTYFKSSFLRTYILKFRTISLNDIEKLESTYPEIDVRTIDLPFDSSELIKNRNEINKYIFEKIKSASINVDENKKNDYNYLIKEFKKSIALKAHNEILIELKNYIKENELNKWDDLYNSEPVSTML